LYKYELIDLSTNLVYALEIPQNGTYLLAI